LWAYLGLQVLVALTTVVLVAMPGETWTFEADQRSLVWMAGNLVVLYFLLRGRSWAWGLTVALDALSVLLLFVMASASIGAVPLVVLCAAGLMLLLLPATRRYVRAHQSPTVRLLQ